MLKRVISGIQATGSIHIGNYLGAIRHWVAMQEDYNCLFFIADLHAITVNREPEELKNSTFSTLSTLLACGIDHERSILFAQSFVREHAELMWLLSCNTSIGWLKRMTQFKDKAGDNSEEANLGLFSYPVLMAADILLYNAHLVPVGEDQKQHLELTRDIGAAVNRKFNRKLFEIPEPLILGKATRVMSLKNGTKKMSKSDPSEYSRINLCDDSDTIYNKIKKAKTDSLSGISFDKSTRPEISNMIAICAEFTGRTVDDIVVEFEEKNFAVFKDYLAEVLVAKLQTINKTYNDYMKNKDYLTSILYKNGSRAASIAESNLKVIKEMFGYIV